MVGMSSVWPVEENPAVESGETALVSAARHDPVAFSRLYQQYLPRIYRYLLARLPTAEDAAEACQQVFLKALEAIPAYDERGLPFAAWIFRIARNTAIDAARRRRTTVPWELLPESAHPLEPEQPESAFLRRESVSASRNCWHRLMTTGAICSSSASSPDSRQRKSPESSARATARSEPN